MVDVSKFGEHPVDVNRVDHDPGEESNAEVVHAHGDEGAQEGQLSQLSVDQHDDQYQDLKYLKYLLFEKQQMNSFSYFKHEIFGYKYFNFEIFLIQIDRLLFENKSITGFLHQIKLYYNI